MSWFSAGIDAHFTALFATAGETVTLKFGPHTTSLTVVPGSTRQERQLPIGVGGTTVDVRSMTFRCWAADYVLNGEAVVPKENHRIIRADGREYQVAPPAPGLPVFERNQHSAVLKIHAMEVRS